MPFGHSELLLQNHFDPLGDARLSLGARGRVPHAQANTRWIAANPTAKISELPTVERANGKPAFLRFAFENPRKAQQAY
jgi:hypothetical protein